MAAQPAASRKKPSAFADSDDAFTARALEFADWSRRNIRLIIGVVVALTVIVGGLLYYRMYQAQREERAAVEFANVEQTAASGNLALAKRDLEAYVRRYEGSSHGDEASLALAQVYLSQDSAAKAVEVLQGAPARIDDSVVGPQAALLLGAAQQGAGNADGAIQTYLTVADEADLKMYQVQALQNAAMLRGEKGDFAGAAELYGRLVELMEEGSMDRQLYEMRLAEAEARAAAK
jgi:predicted negative regulator of RcsB-dependent stress response